MNCFYGVESNRSVLSYDILDAASGNLPAKIFVLDPIPRRAYNYLSKHSRSTVVFNLKPYYSQLSPCGHPAIMGARYYGQNSDPHF